MEKVKSIKTMERMAIFSYKQNLFVCVTVLINFWCSKSFWGLQPPLFVELLIVSTMFLQLQLCTEDIYQLLFDGR